MHRLTFAIAILSVATVLAVGVAVNPAGTPSTGTAQAATGSTKIRGTIKASVHQSFKQMVDEYDAVTTADVVWEEDPDFVFFCHCRPFFPTGEGHIDWSYRQHYMYPDGRDCTDETGGQLVPGAGLRDKTEQMLQLIDVPEDDTQYFFWGSGRVYASADMTFYCDTPATVSAPDFLDIPGPDEWVTATPSPQPVAGPAAASAPICDDVSPFKYPRNAARIVGSCFAYYTDDDSTLEFVKYEWDLQINPEPIIFIHGFLGSEIKCASDNIWPDIPPTLVDMALAGDGNSPAPGACSASVGDIVKEVAGKDIYKSAVNFLDQLSPGNVYYFNWDWRKGPEDSLALLDFLVDKARSEHDNSKVVIMAHSYGGLLARLYVGNAGYASKVARVVTIGTPAWGSPKALFPLYAGIETPDFSPLDWFIRNSDLHEFSRNLTGDYFLYPSQSYGDWLRIDPSPAALDRQGLVDYVRSLEGNGMLLERALNLHASTLDAPYVGSAGDLKFEVVVGTGKATIVGIDILAHGRVRIRYGNGDGTVPAVSAARGPLGPGNPNKLHTHYSCGVEHVPLPGHPQITDGIKDFLKFGDDIDGLTAPCPFRGVEFKHFYLPPITAGQPNPEVGAAAEGALSLEDAETLGIADYLDLPNEKFIVTDAEFPAIALGPGKFLQVTPIAEDGNGKPVVYGPLDGQITISGGVNGPAVKVNGAPAPLSGDVNCDNQVTAMDTLLLLVHAGGITTSQPASCPDIGSGAEPFGDVDCDSSITPMDGLAGLQLVAGVELTLIEDGCQG